MARLGGPSFRALQLALAVSLLRLGPPCAWVAPQRWRPQLQLRSLASSARLGASPAEVDCRRARAPSRLEYDSGRYSIWRWTSATDSPGQGATYRVNYVQRGPQDGLTVLLVHGFGSSAYHWRHNILALANAGYCVYAVDLLGFGRSDKPIVDYGAELWKEQLAAFVDEVIRSPVVLVGNSLGGYAALKMGAERPDLVYGLALVNGAGPFSDADSAERLRAQLEMGGEQTLLAFSRIAAESEVLPDQTRKDLQRALVGAAFSYLRTPARIREVLESVYPVNQSGIDGDLVSSILLPACHPDALEVYSKLVAGPPGGEFSDAEFADKLCQRLAAPLLLLWGTQDPWVKVQVADKLETAYQGQSVKRVELAAGHCPMDEVPSQVNEALLVWIRSLAEE